MKKIALILVAIVLPPLCIVILFFTALLPFGDKETIVKISFGFQPLIIGFLFYRIKNKSFRIGIAFSELIVLILLIYTYIDPGSKVSHKNYSKSDYERNKRIEELNQPLFNKIVKLNQELDSQITVSIDTLDFDLNLFDKAANSIYFNFAPFLSNKVKKEYSIVGDSLFILYDDFDSICFTQGLKISQGKDLIEYIGYNKKLGLHIFLKSFSEFGPNYFVLDEKTCQKIDGLPLISNRKNDFAGIVRFHHDIGDILLNIQIWNIEHNQYKNIVDADIEIAEIKSADFNSLRFSIRGIGWIKNDFQFTIDDMENKISVKTTFSIKK